MKLILNFGLVVLLAAFLAVPALARKHQSKESTSPPESYQATPAPPSPVPVPYPNVNPTKTQTGSNIVGIEGESTDAKHRDNNRNERKRQ